MTRRFRLNPALGCLAFVPLLVAVGCSGGRTSSTEKEKPAGEEEIQAAREKLAPAERTLVEEQEWCVVSTNQRLGSMGVPYKVTVKGQPVFLCCDHCEKKALADPDKTLTTLEAHRKRVKEQKGGKGM